MINRLRLSAPPREWVNGSSTMTLLAPTPRLCHAAPMASPDPVAGGFFLVAPIVIGFVIGVIRGAAMEGALIGAVIGLALLAIVWLVDRRRQRQ